MGGDIGISFCTGGLVHLLAWLHMLIFIIFSSYGAAAAATL
jgi:hypothetical protein